MLEKTNIVGNVISTAKDNIHIYLVDVDSKMTEAWKKTFVEEDSVQVVNMDIVTFLEENKKIDSIVTAGNSFGIMSGGIDAAYIQYFGEELQNAVQQRINDEYWGEQTIGSSIIVDIPDCSEIKFIYTPSMRTPQPLIDPRVVYTCTRSALVTAVRSGVTHVILPAFGHLTGGVKAEIVSELMYRAYKDIFYNNNINDVRKDFAGVTEIDDVLLGHFIWK